MKVSRMLGEVQSELHRVVSVAWISHGKDRELLFGGVTVGYVTKLLFHTSRRPQNARRRVPVLHD